MSIPIIPSCGSSYVVVTPVIHKAHNELASGRSGKMAPLQEVFAIN